MQTTAFTVFSAASVKSVSNAGVDAVRINSGAAAFAQLLPARANRSARVMLVFFMCIYLVFSIIGNMVLSVFENLFHKHKCKNRSAYYTA